MAKESSWFLIGRGQRRFDLLTVEIAVGRGRLGSGADAVENGRAVAAKQPSFRVEKDIAISGAGSIIVAMISVDDSKTIRELAAKYSLKKVLLFGSAARQDSGYRDIDLAVEGIRPQDFFRFYGELMSRLSVPVDVLDMSRPKRFSRIVYREGISLYG
jgi:predicted nucleotidyltransferase